MLFGVGLIFVLMHGERKIPSMKMKKHLAYKAGSYVQENLLLLVRAIKRARPDIIINKGCHEVWIAKKRKVTQKKTPKNIMFLAEL
jgi:hypothetical protein